MEEWVFGAVVATITTLAGAVRHNDLRRVTELEANVKRQEETGAEKLDALRHEMLASNKDLRDEMSRNYGELKADINAKHGQLVGLLLGMKGKIE